MNGLCTVRLKQQPTVPLSGVGTQFTRNADRACKVFCALTSAPATADSATSESVDLNYRFFGDLLPDGTACGASANDEKYCVLGECVVSMHSFCVTDV
jgi:hypothetical protein